MTVLVVNAGSTGLKRHLVAGDDVRPVAGYERADAVGHRIVHGGSRFREPVPVGDETEAALAGLSDLAPLHNAPALRALREARSALPDVPHVAVFDTAFHATLPPEAATYAVPARWRDEWGIRRYGFHGLSVQGVAERVRVSRLVVCHLGGGASVTAVRDGHSVDTTMGFTPLDGVPMATRSGALDPGAVLHLLRGGRLTPAELDHDLEHESGLTGLAGTGDVAALEADGGEAAELALAIYAYRVAAAVGAMAVALGGLDAIVFTGGVGEHSARVRADVCTRLAHLGVQLDAARNARLEGEGDVHAGSVRLAVLHAREERVIARAVERAIR